MADNSFFMTVSKIFNGQALGADFLETGAFWDILEKNARVPVSMNQPQTPIASFCI